MLEPVSITAFRDKAGPYFSDAVHRHVPLAIKRGSQDLGVLLGRDEALALVGDRTFNPEVMRSEGGVSIWLPEFALYGEGQNYAAAKEDLLSETRLYVDEYLANAAEYRAAPNRAAHFPHVVKALIAEARGQLERVIFPGPPDLETLRAQVAEDTSA